jgi:hypothetical protein
MADTLVSDESIEFGITDTTALGFFESLEHTRQADKIEARDGDGDIMGGDYHAKRTQVTGTFVLNTSASLPNVGSSITITQSTNLTIGSTIYVDEIKEVRSNSDVTKVEFSGTAYESIS